MYLPILKVKKIDPELNVNFIKNYLSKEKNENTTRPFFEKTISLYPELECIKDIECFEKREEIIRKAVLRRLKENEIDILNRIEHFTEVFNSFIYDNIEAQCKMYNYQWSEKYPEIHCYVGYLPFYPRSTEEKCFYVSYQDEERVFSGAVHEINHMIFYEKWKEMHGFKGAEPSWPDPLWYLEEIIVDPTLNDERVRPYTLYENKAYPQFYIANKNNDKSIMAKIKECYGNHKNNIEEFIEEAYKIVLLEYGE